MNQYNINSLDAELSSRHESLRLAELNDQLWDRKKSVSLANKEGISLRDEHWDVIVYLRHNYIETGLPRFARTTSRALNKHFLTLGGSKYLYGLFPGGPVTQGSRLANLRTPPTNSLWKNVECPGRIALFPPIFPLAAAIESFYVGPGRFNDNDAGIHHTGRQAITGQARLCGNRSRRERRYGHSSRNDAINRYQKE